MQPVPSVALWSIFLARIPRVRSIVILEIGDFLLSQRTLRIVDGPRSAPLGSRGRSRKRKRRLTFFRQFTLAGQRSVDSDRRPVGTAGKLDLKSTVFRGARAATTPLDNVGRSVILTVVRRQKPRDFNNRQTGRLDHVFPFPTLRRPPSYWNGVCNEAPCFIAGQAEAGTRCVPRPGLFLEGTERRYSTSIHRIRNKLHRRV